MRPTSPPWRRRPGAASRLDEETGRWRLLIIARGLVRKALREFTANRQPAVLERASPLFRTVTGERYHSVVQDTGGTVPENRRGNGHPAVEPRRDRSMIIEEPVAA